MIRKTHPAGGTVLSGRKIAASDIAALAVFFVLFGWFVYVVRFGVNAADEGLYYNIAQRVLQGDRLLVDEWQVSQFSSFLLLLPYKIYTAINGSTQGMILFGRLLYVGVTGVLYWWLYAKYRRFGFCGLAGVALFCAFVPGDMFAVFYLTMTIQGLMVLCTLMFLPSEKPLSSFGWAFCGVVLACVVLAQPPCCLLFLIYTAAVVFCRVRKKQTNCLPALQIRAWLFVTLGVVLTAIPVVLYFLLKSGLPDIIRVFPELFTDTEYDYRFEHFYNLIWKFLILCQNFGYVNSVLWGVLLLGSGAAVVLRKKEERAAAAAANVSGKKRKNAGRSPRERSEALRTAVFAAACCCLVSSYIVGILSFRSNSGNIQSHELYMYYFFHEGPLAVFCAVCGLLLKRRPQGFGAFWWTAVISDVLIAYGSECAFSLAGVILFPLTVVSAVRLLRELTEAVPAASLPAAARRKRVRKVCVGLFAAAACAVVCFESVGFYVSRFCLPMEHYESQRADLPLDTKLDRGPLKGVITNREAAGAYNAVLSDLDEIRQTGDKPVYIMGTCPYLYLYLDTEMGTYSSWYVNEDAFTRQLRYMQLLPEKRPAAVYIPFVDFVTYRIPDPAEEDADGPLYEQKLNWVRQYAACTVAEGQAGYLVYISEWRLPPLADN